MQWLGGRDNMRPSQHASVHIQGSGAADKVTHPRVTTIPSQQRHEFTMNQFDINLLEKYKGELNEAIRPSQLIPHLGELLGIDEVGDIISLENGNRSGAVHKLLQHLRSSENNKWFEQFKISLKKAGYETLFKLMNGEKVKDKKNFELSIRSKLDFIVSQVSKPTQLVLSLLKSKTITYSDQELINAEEKNYGAQRGVIMLLTLLPYRTETWFSDFIKALLKNEYHYVVESIDPRLNKAKTDKSLLRYCSDIRNNGLSTPVEGVGQREDNYRATVTESVMRCYSAPDPAESQFNACGDIEIDGSIGRDERDSLSLTLMSDIEDSGSITTTARAQAMRRSSPEEREPESSDLSTLTISSQEHSNSDTEQHQDDSAISVRSAENIRETSRKSVYDDLTQLDPSSNKSGHFNPSALSRCDSVDSSLNLDLMSEYGDESVNENNLRGRRNKNYGSNSGPDSASQSSRPSTSFSSVKKELKLHNYQKEVLGHVLNGDNVMMCLPTGRGKTCVAIAYAQRLLDDADAADEPKIAFVVPTVALVDQQLNAFLTFLKGNYTCAGLIGDMEEAALPLNEVIQREDVIVMTPQILVNALEKEHIKSLSDFSVIFFDECHHTTKDHPYNKIMAEYYVDKIVEEEQIEDLSVARVAHSLPQIIGLTASPGVGKSCSMNEAMDYILGLCANLSSSRVSIVQEHLEELQRLTNKPTDGNIPVFPRLSDAFCSEVCRLMQEVENMLLTQESIANKANLRKVIEEIPNIEILLKVPAASRGKCAYQQFISKLRRGVAPTDDRELKKSTMSTIRHLEIYNTSLIINEDCRTIDAMNYLMNQMGEVSRVTDTDRKLSDIYQKNVGKLKEISQSNQQDNPKLRELKRCILRCYEKDKQSQGIVFCKTREMTSALVSWIKADPETSWLNPGILKGTKKPGTDSYTKSKLEDALEHFRKGNHKLMFATTVAEEGLDIGQCNYVIRYEYATNSIGRTQARGRARKDQAQYILVSDPNRGNIAHDSANKIKESIMDKALQQVNDLPREDFQRRVREMQHLARLERQRGKAAAAAKERLKEHKRQYDDYELICIKCNRHCTYHTEMRKIQNTHHVLIDPDFRSKAKLEPHPSPKKISCDMQKKEKLLCLHCGMDWGITATYQGVVYPVLKICSFVIVDPNGRKSTAKKWKDVIFTMKENSIEDTEIMSDNLPEN